MNVKNEIVGRWLLRGGTVLVVLTGAACWSIFPWMLPGDSGNGQLSIRESVSLGDRIASGALWTAFVAAILFTFALVQSQLEMRAMSIELKEQAAHLAAQVGYMATSKALDLLRHFASVEEEMTANAREVKAWLHEYIHDDEGHLRRLLDLVREVDPHTSHSVSGFPYPLMVVGVAGVYLGEAQSDELPDVAKVAFGGDAEGMGNYRYGARFLSRASVVGRLEVIARRLWAFAFVFGEAEQGSKADWPILASEFVDMAIPVIEVLGECQRLVLLIEQANPGKCGAFERSALHYLNGALEACRQLDPLHGNWGAVMPGRPVVSRPSDPNWG